MNYLRLGLAALGAMVASFAVGAIIMVAIPALFEEARKYPNVFRAREEMMKIMPIGMGATLVSMLIATIIFAMMHPAGANIKDGAIFGVLMGLFVVFGFVFHNYANLNFGLNLALWQAAAYFVQWVV